MTKIVDKTGHMRPYKGGSYSFMVKYTNGKEELFTGSLKLGYKQFIKPNVKRITIDLA